jgi:hypothetical protein
VYPHSAQQKKNMVVGGTEGYESNRRVNLNEDYNICMHGTMTKGSLCRINLWYTSTNKSWDLLFTVNPQSLE